MKFEKNHALDCLVLVVLVSFGVAARLIFEDIPNFAPVSALALFAGFYFRSWIVAVIVPLAVMMISDLYLGGLELGVRLTVYGALVAPVFARGLMRRWIRTDNRLSTTFSNGLASLPMAIASSALFFLATNFACWVMWYPQTVAGFTSCYVNAIPFFRYTLAGDVCFGFALFAGYNVIRLLATNVSHEVATLRKGDRNVTVDRPTA